MVRSRRPLIFTGNSAGSPFPAGSFGAPAASNPFKTAAHAPTGLESGIANRAPATPTTSSPVETALPAPATGEYSFGSREVSFGKFIENAASLSTGVTPTSDPVRFSFGVTSTKDKPTSFDFSKPASFDFCTIAPVGSKPSQNSMATESSSNNTQRNMKCLPSTLEIRVAIIGYVSVGKTTLLNALLQDKYSEVSMRRTTAGVNLFRISTKPKEGTSLDEGPAEKRRSADSTLLEISEDNKVLRNQNLLQEKTFDIELDEPLFEMRKDTKLVLIDVPGINEAGSNTKYKDYVARNWHTFDCVIVVMDGRQGMNTKEQVDLLKLAKSKCKEEKDISVIVVLNKIDDPHEEEQKLLITESREAVEKIFEVTDRANALSLILEGNLETASGRSKDFSPIVLPMSAIHAFVYRMASKLNFEDFSKKIGSALIEKIGREAFGWQWNQLDEADKIKGVYEVTQDPTRYKFGVGESKFDEFLATLNFSVGGVETQDKLFEDQIKVMQARLSAESDFVEQLRFLYDRSMMLGRAADFVAPRFQELLATRIDTAFRAFRGPKDVHQLAKPMADIESFISLAKHIGIFENVKNTIIQNARHVVLKQMETLLSGDTWGQDSNLTVYDWMLIYGCMVQASCSAFLSGQLGLAGILLEQKFFIACSDATGNCFCKECMDVIVTKDGDPYCHTCKSYFGDPDEVCKKNCHNCGRIHSTKRASAWRCSCGNENVAVKTKEKSSLGKGSPLSFRIADGSFVAANPELSRKHVHVAVPALASDPNHFGHLIWRFCHLLTSVELEG